MHSSPFVGPIDTVLFDFDGTLMDASSAICGAFQSALGGTGPLVSNKRVRAMIGRPLRDMFLDVRPEATEKDVDGLVAMYREAFFPLSVTETHPLPGAEQLLRELTGSKRLGIVTTRLSDGAIRMLRTHGMLDAFECVIGLEHVERAKPDPQPIERALAKLEGSAERAIMVGDTPDDILAGRRAGTGTVGVTTGAYGRHALEEAGAHAVIDSLTDLGPLLRR
jgi:pyrophosphatase PpaX